MPPYILLDVFHETRPGIDPNVIPAFLPENILRNNFFNEFFKMPAVIFLGLPSGNPIDFFKHKVVGVLR